MLHIISMGKLQREHLTWCYKKRWSRFKTCSLLPDNVLSFRGRKMQHALFQLLYAKQRVIFENNCSSFSFSPPLPSKEPYRIIIHSRLLLSIYHLIESQLNVTILFQFSPLYHYKLPTERISNELSNFFQLITRYSLKHNFPPPKNLLSSNMKGDKTGRKRGEKRIHEDFAWKVTRAWGMKKGRYRGDIFLERSRAKTAAVPE